MAGAIGVMGQCLSQPRPRRRAASGSANTASTRASTGAVERNDTSSPTSFNVWPAPRTRRAELVVGAVEFRSIGALERIDRLLAVADREHRARAVARARAGEELLGQRMGDAPLLRGGVLHLVQQQMVQAAVQLVQHPGRTWIDQQARVRSIRSS